MATRESELEGVGYQAWQAARKADSYSIFLPVLTDIIHLKKEIAKATQPDLDVYDANIDIFERGMKVSF
jgi:carboxypeptidase Taq